MYGVYLLERRRTCLFWIAPLCPLHLVGRVLSTDLAKVCDRIYGGITKAKWRYFRLCKYVILINIFSYVYVLYYGYSLFVKIFSEF